MYTGKTFINTAFGLCLLSSVYPAYGAENESDNTEAELPDLEMLEFLGQFATETGDWIDPDSLISDEFLQLLDAVSESNNADADNTETDNN